MNITTETSNIECPNLLRFADSEDIIRYESAVELFYGIYNELLVKGDLSTESMLYFKSQTIKSYQELKRLIMGMHVNLKAYNLYRVCKTTKTHKKLRKDYNTYLSQLMGKFSKDTPFENLLLLDMNLNLLKHVQKVHSRISCLDGYKLNLRDNNNINGDKSKFILRVNGKEKGSRCNFDSAEETLACMKAFIEKLTIEDLYFINPEQVREQVRDKGITYGFLQIPTVNGKYLAYLKIRFPSLPGTTDSEPFILSNDKGLLHILCNEKPPPPTKKSPLLTNNIYITPEFRMIYPIYSEFLTSVYTRIQQIINDNYNNENCIFMILPCCRINPICSCKLLILKPKYSINKLQTCYDCKMDLCTGGCGRVYHGETECSISFDEASILFIDETSKKCPGTCSSNIFKSDGCNHITCNRCRTEFCYTCGKEFEKDSFNHYMITEHYSDSGIGNQNTTSRCVQFS